MTLLNTRALGLTLGHPLFSGLDFSISKGDRIGLVAANGRGKTTLLRCLAGQIEATEGDITRARGLRVGLVEQHPSEDLLTLPFYQAVLAALPDDQAEYESWRVDIALDDLAVPTELRDRPLGGLSGGWQRVALLAHVWVTEPDMLLLDEPTNHLDLSRIGFLQNWLATIARDIPCLVASHDRAFLDAITNRTLFLRAENSRLFPVPYSHARHEIDKADTADEARFANEMKKADQLRRQAAKLKNIGINSGSDLLVNKTKQLKERAEKIEGAARPAHREQSAGAIKLSNSGTHAKALLTLDDVEVTAPDGSLLFKTAKIWINKGDRVVLLGRNGAGKTQLVKRIHAALNGEDSEIRAAATAVIGYSDQSVSQLDRFATPMEAVTHGFDVGDQRARALLAGAGMDFDLQNARLSALSGGQKSRLAMLILRLTQPNFYLLDEPTNHLDIEGQEMLEEELQQRGASCLLVSHDRTFVRNTGTRFWEIQGKRLVEVDSPENFFEIALSDQT